MPALHESVTYCARCDHYVALIETQACDECGAPMCPGCAKPTKDPDLSACSQLCAAALAKRIRAEAALDLAEVAANVLGFRRS